MMSEFSEPHFTIGELAELWNLDRETVRRLVKDESGVVNVRQECDQPEGPEI